MTTPADPTPPGPGLDRTAGDLDRALRDDLDRFMLESAVARHDAAAELTRELQATGPLDLGDVSSALDRAEGTTVPSFSELEGLLTSAEAEGLRLEANLLTDLLREGAEGQTILKRGLAFLKHRKYPLAVEWWTLNRRGLDPATSKLHLLLLIMEALTYQWAGDEARAEAARQKVFSHPLFRRAARPG